MIIVNNLNWDKNNDRLLLQLGRNQFLIIQNFDLKKNTCF